MDLAMINSKMNYLFNESELYLIRCESPQLVQWKDFVEALPEGVQLLPHPANKHPVQGPGGDHMFQKCRGETITYLSM